MRANEARPATREGPPEAPPLPLSAPPDSPSGVTRAELAYNRSLIEASPDPLVTIGPDGRITDVNRATELATGRGRAELIGTDFCEAFSDPEQARLGYQRAFKEGSVQDFELELKHRDGHLTPVLYNASVYRNEAGAVVGVFAAARDISARKRAEAALRESDSRYRALFDRSTDLVYIIGRDGRFIDANQAALKRLGYSREEISHLTLAAILSDDQLPLAQQTLQQIWELGAQQKPVEFRIRHKDGSVVHVETLGATIQARGEAVAALSIARDITERKRAEAERAALEDRLSASQKMEAIGSLAGGVAHDFNNLISVILTYTSFALESVPEGNRLHDDLVEVKKAADRAAALTRQLLAFSRRQVLQMAPLNLNQIVEGVGKMLRRVLGEDIELVEKLAPVLGPARADAGQLEQVLMNLAINARDAMPDGGTLTIETSNLEVDETFAAHAGLPPGPYVQVVVADTGFGMDQQTRARLFEPFFSTKDKGSGLGLSTVYGIVHQSGGSISVTSELGHGSAFTILLPRDTGAAAVAAPLPRSPGRRAEAPSETILVVEDEDALLRVAQRALEAVGYTVLTAASGAAALEAAARHHGPIDLLLTDVVMPVMKGPALARELRKSRPEIKVLYMSGYIDDAVLNLGRLDEQVHLLPKPFIAPALTRMVREVLDEHAGGSSTPVPQPAEAPPPLEPAALRVLPAEVLERLRKAVVAARYDELSEITESLRGTHPALADGLARLADAFDAQGLRALLSHDGDVP